MIKARGFVAVVAASIIVLASAAALIAAMTARSRATATRDNAERLYRARLDVAAAQRKLGSGDLSDAVAAAKDANAAARDVKRLTQRMVTVLEPAGAVTADIIGATATSRRYVTFTRRELQLAAQALGAISGYQGTASRHAGITNRALRRILIALRETNRSFPPGDP